MKKRVIFLLILTVILLSQPIISFGLSAEEGIFHEDGSYQLSSDELKRHNEIYEGVSNVKKYLTYADALKYISPRYYYSLTEEMQENLNFVCGFGETKSYDIQPYEYGLYKGTYASISKYGASLRGYGEFKRTTNGPSDPAYALVIIINQVKNSRGISVGTTYNSKTWPKTGGISISCTTIIDPPNGEYYNLAEFAIPEFCIHHGYKFVEPSVTTKSISYINPY